MLIVRRFVWALAFCVLLVGAAFGAIAWDIHRSVQENCRIAQRAHPHHGDDVAALIDYVNSTSHTPAERTHIGVWTLGRLRDPRALPGLTSAYTGRPCDHANKLCQHELQKAIKRCGGVPNAVR